MIILEFLCIANFSILFHQYNKNLVDFVCDVTQVPYDFSLCFTSAGFGNNIMILLFFVEFMLFILFIEKVIPKLVEVIVWECML